jgi:hypothetical protein
MQLAVFLAGFAPIVLTPLFAQFMALVMDTGGIVTQFGGRDAGLGCDRQDQSSQCDCRQHFADHLEAPFSRCRRGNADSRKLSRQG